MMSSHLPLAEVSRMQHSRKRRRMLEGCWEQDLVSAMREMVSAEQLAGWSKPTVTKNVFRSVVNQLSILYDREPVIDNADAAGAEVMREALRQSGAWTRGTQLQRLAIGQRECLRRVDVIDGELQVRIVPIDVCTLEAHPSRPTEPHTVTEYILREDWRDGGTEQIITRDVLSVADPAAPVYRIESEDGSADLTGVYLDAASYSGDAYPYRLTDGSPVLPYVLTHALDTGRLLDPTEGAEMVNDALRIAVLWSFWGHIVFDASWPQRYAVNAQPAGMDPSGGSGNASFIATDPSSLLILQAINPDAPVSVGQWDPGGDPVQVGEAIRAYSAGVGEDLGLSAGDIQRSHGDARSGYAIHIVNEGKREAQRRYEPQFRKADEQMMVVAAAMLNRATAAGLPESGWGITYRGLPLSLEERKARMEEYARQYELGVTSPVVLLAEIEGVTEAQARARLVEIQRDRATFGLLAR